MAEKQFYASILAKVLIEAGAGIVVDGTDSDEIIGHMVEMECCAKESPPWEYVAL